MISDVEGIIYKVSFIVFGFEGDPDTISRILEIAPTKVWRKGERVRPTALNFYHENAWLWRLPANEQIQSLDASVSSLLEAMEPWVGRLDRLDFSHEREVASVIKATASRASLGLGAATIEKLARLRAGLDVDYYEYWPPESGGAETSEAG